jgi:hypothetical protein
VADQRAKVYVTFSGEYENDETMNLVVKMCQGTIEYFEMTFEAIRGLFDDVIEIGEHVQLSEENSLENSDELFQGAAERGNSESECNPM